jgi:hypothetical protein
MRTISDLIGAIKAEQLKISNSLVDGFVVNFDTYQRLVGQHQGLVKALDILDNLMKEDEEHE